MNIYVLDVMIKIEKIRYYKYNYAEKSQYIENNKIYRNLTAFVLVNKVQVPQTQKL